MKFSESWLRSLFDQPLNLTTEALCEELTQLGLEVESCTPVASPFTGVVTGEIIEAAQHPDADRLRVCQVSTGSEPLLNIVCGAPNARPGIKVCVATIGAVLPGDFKIKEAKLRGVLSQGMLCSEKELGLLETIDGIIELPEEAPLGLDVREYLDLNDHMIEINLTPNRGDCLSLEGIARELTLSRPELKVITPDMHSFVRRGAGEMQAKVPAKEAAPLYILQTVKGVDNTRPTPDWMVKRLARSGVRSVSPVVDILNYVMFLVGEPMHAFDLSKLEGPLNIDFAQSGEKTTLLNGDTITLRPDTLVIRDEKKIVALAGVMGCANSEVSETTTDIAIEAAHFNPLIVAGKARSYGLHTDGSHRFERGVDPTLPHRALNISLQLIEEITGGKADAFSVIEHDDYLPKHHPITLHLSSIEALLGISMPLAFVEKTLRALGCMVVSGKFLTVTPPSHRFDLSIEKDLIEELARVYGYDKIPSVLPCVPMQVDFIPERILPLPTLRQFLTDAGLTEAITYSFMDPDWQAHFIGNRPQYALSNPISKELSSMRQSVIASLLKTLQYNVHRQQESVKLFEIGPRFVDGQEEWVVAGAITDAKLEFTDLKGLVENLYALAGVIPRLSASREAKGGRGDQINLSQSETTTLHPGQSLILSQDSFFGRIHPQLAEALDLPKNTFIFELPLSFRNQGQLGKLKPLSKFPMITRDLAFVVAKETPAGDLITAIQTFPCDFFESVSLFDVYEGKNLPQGQKSLAFSLKLQHPDRTLVDEEVQKYVDELIAHLKKSFGATLRE